jgi:hypothetical protein
MRARLPALGRSRAGLCLTAPTFSGCRPQLSSTLTFALGCGVAVQCGVGDTFIKRSKIAVAFCHLVALGAAPDPALIIALKEIPDHCCTPWLSS